MDLEDARRDLLVRECWPQLLRTAYLMTGDASTAPDLAGAALRRRLGGLPGGTGDDDPATFLRIAVVREAFSRRKLYPAGAAPFAEQWGAPDVEPVRRVLSRLPLDERAVLVLRFREGLDVAQVVDVLKVPDGIVSKRERRGLTALRAAGLAPQDAEPRPDELGRLLDAVAAPLPVTAPPEPADLLGSGTGGRGRRLLLIGATAAAVGAVAVARWL